LHHLTREQIIAHLLTHRSTNDDGAGTQVTAGSTDGTAAGAAAAGSTNGTAAGDGAAGDGAVGATPSAVRIIGWGSRCGSR
jgi:hypothetical protein